jgi:hypothetical protein
MTAAAVKPYDLCQGGAGRRGGRCGIVELAWFGLDPEIGRAPPPIVRGLTASRRYLGSEVCEQLLAPASVMEAAIAASRARGLVASVVLPPVGPRGAKAALALMARVAETAPGTEIVANDWGVLAAAARDERLVPVLGRCLNRMLREPRLGVALGPAAPAAAREALGGGPWASAAFARLRARLRIARIEVDVPPIPIATQCFPRDLPVSLWVPFGLVATGRVCLSASVHRAPEVLGAARFAPGPCRRECREARVVLAAPRSVGGPLALALAGNTVFYEHDETLAARARQLLADLPVDRIVWQTADALHTGLAS